ncbi:MAG: sulfurtransferase TusA family protein [Pseudomonadota bacterium]
MQNDGTDGVSTAGPPPPGPAHDAELDARGLLCPLPVLKTRKRLMAMKAGAVLKVVADDPAALVDVPHFCNEQGHALVDSASDPDGTLTFWVRRAG